MRAGLLAKWGTADPRMRWRKVAPKPSPACTESELPALAIFAVAATVGALPAWLALARKWQQLSVCQRFSGVL